MFPLQRQLILMLSFSNCAQTNIISFKGSQVLPPGTDLLIRDVYEEVKNDSFRGNFIAAVGRVESDKRLLSLVKKHYLSNGINVL